jgi:ABC-type Zn2+ transport system substrate-binding protein/surface adhesin
MEEWNAFAGQGAVLLDIGGDIGALVLQMPADLQGVEIEIRRVGQVVTESHEHSHSHNAHGLHPHGHEETHNPHVAVVARPAGAQLMPSAVFADLVAGDYELYERLDGRVRLTVGIAGGEVTEARWPS